MSQNIFNAIILLWDSCGKNFNSRVESFSFFKKNEHASNFATSFAGVGQMLKPSIEYYFDSNTKLNFGAFGLKYSRLNRFTELIPSYQIDHKLISGLELVLGSLNGNLSHHLVELSTDLIDII